jgi:hypothetical protein
MALNINGMSAGQRGGNSQPVVNLSTSGDVATTKFITYDDGGSKLNQTAATKRVGGFDKRTDSAVAGRDLTADDSVKSTAGRTLGAQYDDPTAITFSVKTSAAVENQVKVPAVYENPAYEELVVAADDDDDSKEDPKWHF